LPIARSRSRYDNAKFSRGHKNGGHFVTSLARFLRRFSARLAVAGLTCKTDEMGRFASTVEFYSRYREPYSPRFFHAVASQLAFRGDEKLLDVGCGPGLLAIGFAPFVGQVTALDPEGGMIEATQLAAREASVTVRCIHERIEEFATGQSFDIVTIGRALHWLDRDATLPVLQRITAKPGRILVCGASNAESAWVTSYDAARQSWTPAGDEKRYKLDAKEWFAGSGFVDAGLISVSESREVTIDELVGRALSKSNTSPEVLGDRRAAFEIDIINSLEPFAQNGILQEEIVSRAKIFERG
jgi:SAM-dependent methyltransferase